MSAPLSGNEPGQQAILLAGLEARVLAQVQARLDDITNHFSAYLTTVIRSGQDLTGTELLSRPDVHNALTTILDGARANTEAMVRAGYRAANKASRAAVHADLVQSGLTREPPPDQQSEDEDSSDDDSTDTGMLALIIAGIVAAFATALLDITASVRMAFDGVTGTAAAVVAARALTTHAAIERSVRRLGVRLRSAAVVAVHRGYTDGQLATIAAHTEIHSGIPMRKRWTVGAADPCPSCRALGGATIPVGEEFDATAGASKTFKPPKVFDNLLGPPRHPRCRCRLVFLPTTAGAAVARTTTATPAPGPVRVTAADIRGMGRSRLTALLAFFRTAASKLRSLIRRNNSGSQGGSTGGQRSV